MHYFLVMGGGCYCHFSNVICVAFIHALGAYPMAPLWKGLLNIYHFFFVTPLPELSS